MPRSAIRTTTMLMAVLVAGAAPAAAEWQIKPFLGAAFAGDTTIVDPDLAVGRPHVMLGATGALLGNVFGLDGDFAYSPGFFQSDAHNVLNSSATTVTGNLVVALPRRLTRYTLRPYVMGGAGIMRVHIEEFSGGLSGADTLPAIDFGGGVTGFLTDRVGLSWEVRRFQSVAGRTEGSLLTVTDPNRKLSFWRANMALAIRY